MTKATPGTEMFIEACQRVIRAAREAKPSALIHYAAESAKVGISDAVQNNAQYVRYGAQDILANLNGWRGEEARKTKEMLRAFI